MQLKRGRIYECKYYNFKEDAIPLLLVISTDGKDTHGINMHYFRKIENKSHQFRMMSSDTMKKHLERWKTGPFKSVFEFLESDAIKKLPSRAIYEVFKARFPLIPKYCYRHYKNQYLAVYTEYEPTHLDRKDITR